MEEAVIATFDDVKFIEGTTKLTQDNWQSYFGSTIKNGVISGLNRDESVLGTYRMKDGILIANGILATITTENGYTEFSAYNMYSSNKYDRFICARIYFDTESVELIEKTNITSIDDSSTTLVKNKQIMRTLMEFAHDESYCCERNSVFYDIPLLYQSASSVNASGTGWLKYGVDLTRRPYRKQNIISKSNMLSTTPTTKISGNDIYYCQNPSSHFAFLFPDIIDVPNDLVIVHRPNYSSNWIALSRVPHNYISTSDDGGVVLDSSYEIKYVFSKASNWKLYDEGGTGMANYFYTLVTPRQEVSLRITHIGTDYDANKCNFIFYVEEI